MRAKLVNEGIKHMSGRKMSRKEMFSKEMLSSVLGQRIMDYEIDGDENISFSLNMRPYGYDDFIADFLLCSNGLLIWIPDIPTEELSPKQKILLPSDINNALEDFGNWEPNFEDED